MSKLQPIKQYSRRVWLNPEDSPYTGAVCCFVGQDHDAKRRSHRYQFRMCDCLNVVDFGSLNDMSPRKFRRFIEKFHLALQKYKYYLDMIECNESLYTLNEGIIINSTSHYESITMSTKIWIDPDRVDSTKFGASIALNNGVQGIIIHAKDDNDIDFWITKVNILYKEVTAFLHDLNDRSYFNRTLRRKEKVQLCQINQRQP